MEKADKNIRILFLSQRFLFPQDTGGKIRTGKILERLNERYSITVVSNVESPQDDQYLPRMKDLCDKFIQVPWVETKRYTLKWYFEILRKSFSIYPVTMLNDYSPELEKAVLTELKNENYDLAICDFMQSTLNFQKVKNIPTLLFQHNVEAAISQRHLHRSKDPLSKLFWWLQFRKMFYHEKKQCNRYDSVIAVSDADKNKFEDWYGLRNVHTIPTGVDTEYYSTNGGASKKNKIVFVGAMDWLPNQDAMQYFLDKIFPLIQKERPKAKFVIVGRNPSPKLMRVSKNMTSIEVTGWVDDTRPYIADASVFIVPIRIGGGTRMKIYEGMAMGKAIVSTSIGAEGLPLKHEEHIFFADDETEFAKHVVDLIDNEKLRKDIGARARKYVYENFRWQKVADVFAKICETTIDNKNPATN